MQELLKPISKKTLSAEKAGRWMETAVETIGVGFHPDTPGEDYVNPEGNRLFTDAQAVVFNANVDRTLNRLAEESDDPYTIAAEAQGRLLQGISARSIADD